MQMCPRGSLTTNEPDQPLYQLRDSFLPAADFEEMRAELLVRNPAMRAADLAEGFTAVNVNFNLQGKALL